MSLNIFFTALFVANAVLYVSMHGNTQKTALGRLKKKMKKLLLSMVTVYNFIIL